MIDGSSMLSGRLVLIKGGYPTREVTPAERQAGLRLLRRLRPVLRELWLSLDESEALEAAVGPALEHLELSILRLLHSASASGGVQSLLALLAPCTRLASLEVECMGLGAFLPHELTALTALSALTQLSLAGSWQGSLTPALAPLSGLRGLQLHAHHPIQPLEPWPGLSGLSRLSLEGVDASALLASPALLGSTALRELEVDLPGTVRLPELRRGQLTGGLVRLLCLHGRVALACSVQLAACGMQHLLELHRRQLAGASSK